MGRRERETTKGRADRVGRKMCMMSNMKGNYGFVRWKEKLRGGYVEEESLERKNIHVEIEGIVEVVIQCCLGFMWPYITF